MVDDSLQENGNREELPKDTLAGEGLIQQDPDSSIENSTGDIKDENVENPEIFSGDLSLDNGLQNDVLLNSDSQQDIESNENLLEMNDENSSEATPQTLKAGTLKATLGNGVLDMDTIRNIKVNVQAVLGGVSMSVSKLSNLKEGELISLEKTIGEEIEILANGQLIARGEIVVIEGDVPKFGITITSIVGS